MPKIFIGKIGSTYPEQIDKNIYVGRPRKQTIWRHEAR